MVDKNTAVVSDDLLNADLNTEEKARNYKLVDCQKGICKQTEGYILEKSGKVVAFSGEAVGDYVDSNSADDKKYHGGTSNLIENQSQCNNDYIGKIYHTDAGSDPAIDGVCIYYHESETPIGIDFITTELAEGTIIPSYIINEGVADTPFAGGIFIVRSGVRYIIKDLFYNSK